MTCVTIDAGCGVYRRGNQIWFGSQRCLFSFSLSSFKMATVQSPVDMDISDGSNSDMDVSESDQETESGSVKAMASKQTTTYAPISPFAAPQYYPRTTASDAAMLGYAPGHQFGSNTQNMMADTRTNMMNPFYVSGIILFGR